MKIKIYKMIIEKSSVGYDVLFRYSEYGVAQEPETGRCVSSHFEDIQADIMRHLQHRFNKPVFFV